MNYYKAVEKKPEHGGGWVFMQLNRREGAAVVCACDWSKPGHATAWGADRCFYDHELAKGLRRSELSGQLLHCRICTRWTAQVVSAGNLLFDAVVLCDRCAPPDDDVKTRKALSTAVQFVAGIEITASW